MQNKVKILLEGFTNADRRDKDEDEITRCTTTIIKTDDMIILSDPGVLESQQIMVDALAKENLTINDITHVFITHSHMDHYRNIGMFPSAKSVDYWGLWDGAKCDEITEQFSKDIKIIKTPGHSYDGLTMIIDVNEEKIAIAGDLWWNNQGPDFDPYASDMNKLKESRAKVLKLADYIIPGHGKMFKVEK